MSRGALVTPLQVRLSRPVNTFSNPQDQRSEHTFLLFGRGMRTEGGLDAARSLKELLGKS